jgi:toxin ParE1/3/4
MRVVWLRRALRNLEEAAAWIARDNPAAAVAMAARIEAATRRLADFPGSGRQGRIAGTRELVLHTARRWPTRLT